MITKPNAMHCTTHHTACDCREYRFQQMEEALKTIRSWARYDLEDDYDVKALNTKDVFDFCNMVLEK